MKSFSQRWQTTWDKKLNRYAPLMAVVVIFGGLGTTLLLASHAATSTVSLEPESGTISSATTNVSDSSASGSHAVKFGFGSSGSSCIPLSDIPAGFPNNCTTGYVAASDYPGSLHTCSDTITNNTTYNFCSFSGLSVGSAASPVSNVTFHGCLFKANAVDGGLVVVFANSVTFDYSTFQPNATFVHNSPVAHNTSYQYGIAANGSYNSFAKKMTVSHSDFWGFGNAIDTQGSTQANPQVFSDNWIHDAANDGNADYHTDGIGDESGSGNGSYVVINHNTIVSPGNTNGIAFQQGSYSNFTITNNLVSGFGYTVALWAPAPNTTFTGNTYSTLLQPTYGPLYPQSFWTSSGSYWHDNKWLVPAGAAYGNPSDSGKFWTPDGPSSTDYQ